jgi:hypothetical protein
MKPLESHSYTIGYCCNCGADAVYYNEWDDIEWEGGDGNCKRHTLAPQDELMDELDRLLDRIRETGSFLASIDPMKVAALPEDGEDDSKHYLFTGGGR